MENNIEKNQEKKQDKKKKPIPPSATFVDPSGDLEKKVGVDTSNEGLNASTQRCVW
jgi:hypothetical protein